MAAFGDWMGVLVDALMVGTWVIYASVMWPCMENAYWYRHVLKIKPKLLLTKPSARWRPTSNDPILEALHICHEG